MMHRGWWGLALAGLIGCASAQAPSLPMPPVQPVSATLAKLRIRVLNASDEEARTAGESQVTGYTMNLRQSLQLHLARAGYTVVIQPGEPHDLLARAHVAMSSDRPGTATLALVSLDGHVVEQLSAAVETDSMARLLETGPASMVDRIAQSQRVAIFAKDRTRASCERLSPQGPGQSVIAAPAEGR